ncbi:hypothetical protein AB2M62_14845 [Sphingomonas sp. MMS12-HWE2-04]|uniref:hypothetical protein n=1 Tax=Sphingomonas sp. MMS12-HWE2-04 TaxID=3234199 RepID=UPI00384E68E1
MSGKRERRRIAQAAALGARLVPPFRRSGLGGRGARPGFAELVSWPRWPGLDDEARASVWAVAALVEARDALAEEIDGSRLRDFAAQVGAEPLEAVLALPPGGRRALPEPGDLAAEGRELAEAALPPVLAGYLGIAAAGGDRDIISAAERIAR